MTTVTVELPPDLAQRLQSHSDRLPDILEMGLRQWQAARQPGFQGAAEILELLATLPSPEEILALRPSKAFQDRVQTLLDKNQEEGLSPTEEQEWQQYEYLEHLVRMAKARALLKQKRPMSDYIPASLRQQILERAGKQCEYCLMPQVAAFVPLEVDHIIARKHGGETEIDNLALSCRLCNKHKGSDLTSIDPESGEIVPLFHPRRQRWQEHFRLEAAKIVPLTETGRVTVALLQLNRPERIAEREILLAIGVIQIPA